MFKRETNVFQGGSTYLFSTSGERLNGGAQTTTWCCQSCRFICNFVLHATLCYFIADASKIYQTKFYIQIHKHDWNKSLQFQKKANISPLYVWQSIRDTKSLVLIFARELCLYFSVYLLRLRNPSLICLFMVNCIWNVSFTREYVITDESLVVVHTKEMTWGTLGTLKTRVATLTNNVNCRCWLVCFIFLRKKMSTRKTVPYR